MTDRPTTPADDARPGVVATLRELLALYPDVPLARDMLWHLPPIEHDPQQVARLLYIAAGRAAFTPTAPAAIASGLADAFTTLLTALSPRGAPHGRQQPLAARPSP